MEFAPCDTPRTSPGYVYARPWSTNCRPEGKGDTVASVSVHQVHATSSSDWLFFSSALSFFEGGADRGGQEATFADFRSVVAERLREHAELNRDRIGAR